MKIYRGWTGIMVVLTLLPLLAFSQTTPSGSSEKFRDYLRSGSDYGLGLKPLGFLDPSRMTFSHSFSSTYALSGQDATLRNLFMETIGYRISDPLRLTFNVGYMHQPYSSYGETGLNGQGAFLGSAALTWQPRNNMFLQVKLSNFPNYSRYNYPYDPYVPRFVPYDDFYQEKDSFSPEDQYED